mmetsp:Transcript_88117/g.247826  ORF Transcript_88117/g.247826 Transcript_88117/m.247826 type:complete len:276 (-) Transcript_88117:2797-3624(-)
MRSRIRCSSCSPGLESIHIVNHFTSVSQRAVSQKISPKRTLVLASTSGATKNSMNPIWEKAMLTFSRSRNGCTAMDNCFSRSPCTKNSSINKSAQCLHTTQVFIGKAMSQKCKQYVRRSLLQSLVLIRRTYSEVKGAPGLHSTREFEAEKATRSSTALRWRAMSVLRIASMHIFRTSWYCLLSMQLKISVLGRLAISNSFATCICSNGASSLYRTASSCAVSIKNALLRPGWPISWQRDETTRPKRSSCGMKVSAEQRRKKRCNVKVTSTACAQL